MRDGGLPSSSAFELTLVLLCSWHSRKSIAVVSALAAQVTSLLGRDVT